MADFCKECSEEIFGEDLGDLTDLCKENEMISVLCEGCGYIYVDHKGIRVSSKDDKCK